MQTMTLKAVATVTDAGTFTAVISTEAHDREGDSVSAPGLVTALKAWNRPIPLTWHHSTKAEDVFGSIDPESARAENAEVVVDGTVDIESERGKQAWPLMKAGVIGFSYGYLIPDDGSTPNTKGGRDITALDVFEVTATITPMNNGTRVVDTKAIDDAVTTLQKRVEDLTSAVDALIEKSTDVLKDGVALQERSDQTGPADGASSRRNRTPNPEHLKMVWEARAATLAAITGRKEPA